MNSPTLALPNTYPRPERAKRVEGSPLASLALNEGEAGVERSPYDRVISTEAPYTKPVISTEAPKARSGEI